MSAREIDCAYADQHDLAALYLGRRLTEDEAAAFEAHYLGCQKCWKAVEGVGEIRVALDQPFLEGRSTTNRDWLTPLAAAAVVAVFAIGLVRLSNRPYSSEARVLRTAADRLELIMKREADGQIVIEWAPPADASTYRVSVRRSDGFPILRSETADHTLVLSVDALPPLPSGVSLVVNVDALSRMGHVIASSGPTRVLVE